MPGLRASSLRAPGFASKGREALECESFPPVGPAMRQGARSPLLGVRNEGGAGDGIRSECDVLPAISDGAPATPPRVCVRPSAPFRENGAGLPPIASSV